MKNKILVAIIISLFLGYFLLTIFDYQYLLGRSLAGLFARGAVAVLSIIFFFKLVVNTKIKVTLGLLFVLLVGLNEFVRPFRKQALKYYMEKSESSYLTLMYVFERITGLEEMNFDPENEIINFKLKNLHAIKTNTLKPIKVILIGVHLTKIVRYGNQYLFLIEDQGDNCGLFYSPSSGDRNRNHKVKTDGFIQITENWRYYALVKAID